MGKNQKRQNRSGRGRASAPGTGRSKTINLKKSPTLREFSSGGVVFKREKDEILWLVRSTKPSSLFPKQYWMLPKGWIDDAEGDIPGPITSGKVRATEEDLQKAAVREVKEEGGIEANVVKKIGSTKIFYTHPVKGPILKFVTFYLMEWKKDLQEGHGDETEEVLWLPYEEAYKKLSFGNEKQILKKAKEI